MISSTNEKRLNLYNVFPKTIILVVGYSFFSKTAVIYPKLPSPHIPNDSNCGIAFALKRSIA